MTLRARWTAGLIVLACALAVAQAPGARSATAPTLTQQFPLGTQRLCCQTSTPKTRRHATPPITTSPGTLRGPTRGARDSGSSATVFDVIALVALVVLFTLSGGALRARVRRRRPRARGHPAGALDAGLARSGQRDGAEAAYQRAAQRGDASAAFALGGLLMERGDPRGATWAFARADELGHGSAASNLGALLEEAGDTAGAIAAYGRSDARGNVNGAFNLGSLLAEGGKLEQAAAAFERAVARGDSGAAIYLGAVLERLHDFPRAASAYEHAATFGGLQTVERAQVALGRLRRRVN